MERDFLSLPARAVKPRSTGLTHVLDKGLPVPQTTALLEAAGEFVDIWKFGWGSAYLDRQLEQKLALLAEHGVRACLGGTLLEIAWSQDTLLVGENGIAALTFCNVEIGRLPGR